MATPFDFSEYEKATSIPGSGKTSSGDVNYFDMYMQRNMQQSSPSDDGGGSTYKRVSSGIRPQETGSKSTTTGESRVEYEGIAPGYEKFEYDKGRVESLVQKYAGRGLRRASEGLLRAITGINTGGIDNPIARAQMYRQAVQGYSAGIGNVFEGAEKSARGEYGQEYQAGALQHKLEFEADTRGYERTGVQKNTGTTETERSYQANPFAPTAPEQKYYDDGKGNQIPLPLDTRNKTGSSSSYSGNVIRTGRSY